jgi:hypothetical protein
MALEKVVTEDKIEIIGMTYKAVQIRTCTQVLEDGVELSSGYHRHVVSCRSRLQQRISRGTGYLCCCAYC